MDDFMQLPGVFVIVCVETVNEVAGRYNKWKKKGFAQVCKVTNIKQIKEEQTGSKQEQRKQELTQVQHLHPSKVGTACQYITEVGGRDAKTLVVGRGAKQKYWSMGE